MTRCGVITYTCRVGAKRTNGRKIILPVGAGERPIGRRNGIKLCGKHIPTALPWHAVLWGVESRAGTGNYMSQGMGMSKDKTVHFLV